jgi:hypothetical protein
VFFGDRVQSYDKPQLNPASFFNFPEITQEQCPPPREGLLFIHILFYADVRQLTNMNMIINGLATIQINYPGLQAGVKGKKTVQGL